MYIGALNFSIIHKRTFSEKNIYDTKDRKNEIFLSIAEILIHTK